MNASEIKRRTKHHPPSSDKVVAAHTMVRETIAAAMKDIGDAVPDDCREKSLAMTKLEEAMMWANAAIARNQ